MKKKNQELKVSIPCSAHFVIWSAKLATKLKFGVGMLNIRNGLLGTSLILL